MYEQSLPPTEDSPEVAAIWAREVALTLLPAVADDAAQAARDLVAQAIPRTPSGEMIHAAISVSDTGLRVVVRDPNQIAPRTGMEIAQLSSITKSLGSEATLGEHLAWAELRPSLAATA